MYNALDASSPVQSRLMLFGLKVKSKQMVWGIVGWLVGQSKGGLWLWSLAEARNATHCQMYEHIEIELFCQMYEHIEVFTVCLNWNWNLGVICFTLKYAHYDNKMLSHWIYLEQ